MAKDDAASRDDALRRAIAHAADHFEEFERKLESAASLLGRAPPLVPQIENHFASRVSAAMRKMRIG